MNEPHRGYINIPSLHSFDYNTDLHLSHVRESSLPSLLPSSQIHSPRNHFLIQLLHSNPSNSALGTQPSSQPGRGHSPCPLNTPRTPCLTPRRPRPGAPMVQRRGGACGSTTMCGGGTRSRIRLSPCARIISGYILEPGRRCVIVFWGCRCWLDTDFGLDL